MACSVSVEEQIKIAYGGALKQLGLPLGQYVRIADVLKVQNELAEMTRVSQGITFIKGSLLGRPNDLVKVEITIPEDLLDVYNSAGKVDESKIRFRFRDNYSRLAVDEIKAVFETRQPELKRFIEDALVQIKSISISKFKGTIKELPKDVQNELLSVVARLEDARAIDDLGQMVNAYSAYLLEANIMSARVVEKMKEIENDPEAFYKMMELHTLISSYKPILESLVQYMTGDNNLVAELVQETSFLIKQAEEIYIQKALSYSLDKYEVIYEPTVEKMRAQMEEQIARLQLVANKSSKPEPYLAKIEEIRQTFENEVPSRENLRKSLTGQTEDISMIPTLLRSFAANPDLVVSGLMETLNQQMNEVTRQLTDLRQTFSEELGKFKQFGPVSNVEKEFDGLWEIYEHHYFDGTAIQVESRAALLTPYDISYLTVHSKYTAQLDQLKAQQLEGSDVAEQIETLRAEFKAWRLNTYNHKYTDAYYEVERILDEVVGGQTVKDIQTPFMEDRSNIYAEIRRNGYIPTSDQIEELKRINSSLRKLRSFEGKLPNTDEYRIAEVLETYYKAKNEMVTYEMTPDALSSFNRAKKEIEDRLRRGEITGEQANSWYELHTQTIFSEEFNTKFKDLTNELQDIMRKAAAITGQPFDKPKDSKIDVIQSLARPYRDQDGIVDGTLVSEDTTAIIKQLEELLYAESFQKIGLDGLTREEKLKVTELYKKAGELLDMFSATNDSTYIQARNKVMDEIGFIQNKKNTKPEILALKKDLDSVLKRMAELYTKQPTAYYKETYQENLSRFMSERAISSVPPNDFVSNGVSYKFEDGEWKLSDGVEWILIDDSAWVEDAWRKAQEQHFESDPWFQANHILEYKFDPNTKEYVNKYRPIYTWLNIVPNDPVHIISRQPGFHWQERIVKDEYLNPNYKLDLMGRPLPKNQTPKAAYTSLSQPQKDFLNFLRETTTKYQEGVPENLRIGFDLPSIERKESLMDMALNPNGERLKSQVARRFFTNEQDKDEAYGDTSNRLLRFQPMFYSGRIDPNLVSYNLYQSYLRYTGELIKYRLINENALPLATATEDLLTRFTPEMGKQNKIAKRLGISRGIKKDPGSSNRLYAIRELTNTFIYGEKEFQSEGYTITKDSWLGKIAPSTVGKNLKWEKVFNQLLGTRAFTLMAGSILPQIGNAGGGMIQQMIQAAIKKGRTSFSWKEWAKAWKDVSTIFATQYIADMHKTGNKSKFTLMLDYFNAIPLDLLNTAGYELDENGVRKAMSSDILFFVKNSVEFSLASSTFMAMARSWRMQKGKTLWDSFSVKNGRLEMTSEVSLAEMDRFIKHLNAANRDINGNYSQMDRTIVEKFWFGRAVMFMKKFIVPFIERRYSARRFSNEYEQYIEGYWRSGTRILGNSIQNFMKNRSFEEMSLFYDSLTVEEQDGVRMFVTELTIMAVLIMVAGMVYDPDDEDRFKEMEDRADTRPGWAYNAFIYGLLKTKSEAETFVFPFGLDEIRKFQGNALRELFPMITNFYDLITNMMDWDKMELRRYKQSTATAEKGDLRLTHDLFKLIGYQSYKLDDPIAGIKGLEAAKRK